MTDLPKIRAINYLPAAFHSKEMLALFGGLDRQFEILEDLLDPDHFTQQFLDPETSTALDYRASMSLARTYWSVDWPQTAKVEILKNQVWLANNRYNPLAAMPKLFQWFGLDATIAPIAGFILGAPIGDVETAGLIGNLDHKADPLGVLDSRQAGDADGTLQRFKIIVPASYGPGTWQLAAVNEIIKIMSLPYTIPVEHTA